ncbi:MAG: S41 family peptidase, partial [Chloroflexota bacterium]
FEERLPYAIGATEAVRRRNLLRVLLRGAYQSTLTLSMHTVHDEPKTVVVPRRIPSAQVARFPEPRPAAAIHPLADQIIYVDLTRITRQEFTAALPRLSRSPGLILDLRGWTRVVNHALEATLSHLTPVPIECPYTLRASITLPDGQQTEYDYNQGTLLPRDPTLMSRVACLVDERTVSETENFCAVFREYRMGAIIGNTTGGTCGVVDQFTLFDTYDVTWTAQRVHLYNDEPLHAVGISPTISIQRTLNGVMNNQDDVLNAAITWIEKGLR